MIKVSIIVPVHNSEHYLHKCVDSLLEQTLEEIEIILVDDASTDSSRSIMAAYQAKWPEKVVTLYLDENIRQGGARNRGLEIARGEYIAFVDSDDFIEPDMCRVLYEAAQGADMAGADYYQDFGDHVKQVSPAYKSAATKEDYIRNCGMFWSRIYRRAFLLENGLLFPENVYYEDAWFNFMTALYAKSIVKAEGTFYHYYQSPDSTMRSRNKPHQYERLQVPRLIIRDCRERGVYDRYKDLVDYKYISMQSSNILYTCLALFDEPEVVRLAQIRQAIREDCPDFAKGTLYTAMPLYLRCYLRLTLFSPKLTVWLYRHGADRWIELWSVLLNKLSRRNAK